MAKPYLALQQSEGVIVQSAARIYAAYIAAGRVPEGSEQEWMDRSIREALRIARVTDETIQADGEMD
jgi:hypothetical protein